MYYMYIYNCICLGYCNIGSTDTGNTVIRLSVLPLFQNENPEVYTLSQASLTYPAVFSISVMQQNNNRAAAA